jgi:hypothetical protein
MLTKGQKTLKKKIKCVVDKYVSERNPSNTRYIVWNEFLEIVSLLLLESTNQTIVSSNHMIL